MKKLKWKLLTKVNISVCIHSIRESFGFSRFVIVIVDFYRANFAVSLQDYVVQVSVVYSDFPVVNNGGPRSEIETEFQISINN